MSASGHFGLLFVRPAKGSTTASAIVLVSSRLLRARSAATRVEGASKSY